MSSLFGGSYSVTTAKTASSSVSMNAQIESAIYQYGRWAVLRLANKGVHANDYNVSRDIPRSKYPYEWYNYPYGIWLKLRFDMTGVRDMTQGQIGTFADSNNSVLTPMIKPGNVIMLPFNGTPDYNWPVELQDEMTNIYTGIPIKQNDTIIIPDYWEVYPPNTLSLNGIPIEAELDIIEAHQQHIESPVAWMLSVRTKAAR